MNAIGEMWAVNVIFSTSKREILRVFDELEEADLFAAAARNRGHWVTLWEM